MNWLYDLLCNPFLITGVSSWFIAQVLKTIIYAIINKKIDLLRLIGDGGMPSGHSATVTSVAMISALVYGTGSFQFAITAILAVIVCHDATGVRLETGKQAMMINELVKAFEVFVSNPPFKLDFPEYRDTLAADMNRFWAGVPNAVKKVDPMKPKMAIYTCFIQHVLNSLKATGKGAVVIPTGFITAKSGVEKKILQCVVDKHWVYGCVSMPSNVFATTGTNVSVIFFDKSALADKVILIDASKLGEEYKEGNNQKRRLRDNEIDLIVNTFRDKEAVEDFSVAVTYEEIKEKGYSLSAGQYFDIKIDYVDITEEEFNQRMANYKQTLAEQFAESHRLEEEIMKQLDALHFNANVGNE